MACSSFIQPGDDPFGLLPQARGQQRVVGDRFGLGALAVREILPGDARDRRVRRQEHLGRRALGFVFQHQRRGSAQREA